MKPSLPTKAPWRLLERDQLVLCLLCAAMLATAGVLYVLASRPRARGVQKLAAGERIDYRVDLNRSTVGELDLLPGIGPARAARIVEYRTAHGPFRTLGDLARVPGMSRDCVEKLRGLVTPDANGPPGEADR